MVIPSGLVGLLTDAREFLAAVRFARPEAFWLLLVLPLLGLANHYAASRRRQATAGVGRPAAVAGLRTHPRDGRRWLGLVYPLGWVLLITGLAGPQWGTIDQPGTAVGRDIVLVLDLSRSMCAEDMAARDVVTRWEAGQAGLIALVDAAAARTGHRIAVVVFAASPKLVCPLTTDYDHVRAVLRSLNGQYPPLECRIGPPPDPVSGARKEPASGTRIGLAIEAAVEVLDRRDEQFLGRQDIVLVSDGDDPANDGEWEAGWRAALAARIPVHTVGVGDPNVGSPIPTPDGFVELPGADGQVPTRVMTRLRYDPAGHDPLQEIARRTGGRYVAAQREVPRLGAFFRDVIEPGKDREVSDDPITMPVPIERYPWFLGPALALFAIGWLRGR